MRDPEIRDGKKWRPKEELGGNGRAREGERKNHRNARSVYITSQKAWFTAFIAIIKKSRTYALRGNNFE